MSVDQNPNAEHAAHPAPGSLDEELRRIADHRADGRAGQTLRQINVRKLLVDEENGIETLVGTTYHRMDALLDGVLAVSSGLDLEAHCGAWSMLRWTPSTHASALSPSWIRSGC